MRKRTIITASAVLAVGFIAIPTAADAGNGRSWLLGRSNYESATTTVTNSTGTPLSLKAKTGYAPLKVNSSKTVTNLSADTVDGVHASSLARSTAKSGVVFHDGTLDGVGAKCPSGTIATGGGGYDPLGWTIWYSGPDFTTAGTIIPNSWVAIDENGYALVSFANCVNVMGGGINGAVTSTDQLPSPADAASPEGLNAQPEGAGVPADLLKMRAKALKNPKPTK